MRTDKRVTRPANDDLSPFDQAAPVCWLIDELWNSVRPTPDAEWSDQ